MSVLRRFTNVARGWVRAHLAGDPDEAAARAALEAEGTLPSGDRTGRPTLDPDTTTEESAPVAPPPGPPETDDDGNVKRTL
jgi:hypothetical protein